MLGHIASSHEGYMWALGGLVKYLYLQYNNSYTFKIAWKFNYDFNKVQKPPRLALFI